MEICSEKLTKSSLKSMKTHLNHLHAQKRF